MTTTAPLSGPTRTVESTRFGMGGMRASIYNAMPIEGVRALVAYMREFEAAHG